MNEEQYRLLCEVCDRTLLAPDSRIERVAISWLHVIREHPVFLQNYVDLFESGKGMKDLARRCRRTLRAKAGWIRQLSRTFRFKRPWYGELPEKTDVLFVSHLLNFSQAGQTDDFYFGRVPHELTLRNHSVLIALINHSTVSPIRLAERWNGSSVSRVILSDSLNFCEEFINRSRLRKEARRLRELAKKESPGQTQRILAKASEEALADGSLTAMRMERQIRMLVAKLRPKAVVVTYEGHAWERMVFAAARSASPQVCCIGYQHAALFRLQHASRRSLPAQYNPDHILTAGTIGKAQVDSAPGLMGIRVSILGSNRSFKPSKANAERQQQVGNADPFACVVLPEGIPSECHLLFEFSLACAEACPAMQFLWRLHPLITFEVLAKQNRKFRKLPRNVVVSNKTFGEDVTYSQWALYRGSTAVVQAVSAGLRPIYLRLPGEMTLDPLYELTGWRAEVETVEEFRKVVSADRERGADFLKPERQSAEMYCQNFFLPFDSKVLADLLPNG